MRKVEAEITDIFSSVQGEGVFVGAKQVFVRFKGCNMDCAFCDEKNAAAPRIFTPGSLMDEVKALVRTDGPCHSVSLTGGEPLMYPDFLEAFLPLLRGAGIRSYLETNGTLPDELARVIGLVDIVAMDFKLPSSTGEGPLWDEHFEFLKTALRKNVFVKAVVIPDTTVEDVEKAVELIVRAGKNVPLILQPVTPAYPGDREVPKETLLKFLDAGLRHGLDSVRIIPQVHKALKFN